MRTIILLAVLELEKIGPDAARVPDLARLLQLHKATIEVANALGADGAAALPAAPDLYATPARR